MIRPVAVQLRPYNNPVLIILRAVAAVVAASSVLIVLRLRRVVTLQSSGARSSRGLGGVTLLYMGSGRVSSGIVCDFKQLTFRVLIGGRG